MIELHRRTTWRRSCSPRLVVFLLLGYPVAFALASIGLLFFVIGIELGLSRTADQPVLAAAQALPDRVFGIMATRRCSPSRSSPSWG